MFLVKETRVTRRHYGKNIIADRAPHSFPPSSSFRAEREREARARARWLWRVGCKFALNEMRRYGAFQSEVNSFPTINCIPPPIHYTRVPRPSFSSSLSLLRSSATPRVYSLVLSQRSFSLVFHIYARAHTRTHTQILLAPRRTRHVSKLHLYLVLSNNVCPEGREITDFVGRRTVEYRPIFVVVRSVAVGKFPK